MPGALSNARVALIRDAFGFVGEDQPPRAAKIILELQQVAKAAIVTVPPMRDLNAKKHGE
jgi:hypothetical protein